MGIFAALYIDEDMSALVATLLQARGLDIQTTQAAGCMGRSDVEQLAYAISVKRCLITHNRVDFERIHLQMMERSEQHFGIIIVPQKNPYEIA